MSSILYDANFGTLKLSHQSSDLNSLAHAGYAFGTDTDNIVDNSVALKLLLFAILNLGSITPTGAAHMRLFLVRSIDGTNYEDPQTAADPPAGMPGWSRGMFAGASAKVILFGPILLSPGKSKILIGNSSGVSLAASGNSVKYWFTTYANV